LHEFARIKKTKFVQIREIRGEFRLRYRLFFA